MSCHSRDGFKATARLSAVLTGADRRDVEKTLHALRKEATGADLPAPTTEEVDQWYGRMLTELDAANLPDAVNTNLGKALMRARYEEPGPDGRDFHVQSALLDRVRQQQLIKNTPGLVNLDPPGAQAGQYELGADGRPAKIWYASYGSNLYKGRFDCYIEGGSPNGGKTTYAGCRDNTPPEGTIPIAMPGSVHYAGESGVWGGGVAFLDPNAGGQSLGRAHLIRAEQFDDVVAQESDNSKPPSGDKVDTTATIATGRSVGKGVYGTLVHVGDYQGAPVMTFTSPFTARDALRGDLTYTPENTLVPAAGRESIQAAQHATQAAERVLAKKENRPPKRTPADWGVYSNAPSQSYKDMIGGGLTETFGLNPRQNRTYFAGATGNPPAPPAPSTTKAA